MIQVKKEIEATNTENIVYDISLDGTVVNALGCNINSNTDGFNFQMPSDDKFRYTEENPYISNGKGRNSEEGKAYTKVEGDVAEFEDIYFYQPWNGGVNKMGLGVDEYVPASINYSRKNYSDLLDNGKTKLVGNTVKSRKMSGYLENFLTGAIDLLLHGKGQEFLDLYYDYISKIFNYQIPLRDIASKGKIKKTISDYIADCKTTTKSGSKKSRQAWYELVLEKQKIDKDFKVEIDDTIYYINTGVKKSESDVKRITHQYCKIDGKEVEINSKVKKQLLTPKCEELGIEYKSLKTKQIKEMLKPFIIKEEDEIILNCKLVPRELIEADEDILCNDEIEYNVVKYIDQFNSRIKPLLVCFSPNIRSKIMITDPSERPYFTESECELVSGFPNKETDQDTYEALMTPERKEIEYWLSIGEEPPFIKECEINWEKLVDDYKEIKKKEDDALFIEENNKYLELLNSLTQEERIAFESESEIPSRILDIVEIHDDLRFYFKQIPTMTPSTGGNVFEDLGTDIIRDIIDSENNFEKAEIGITNE